MPSFRVAAAGLPDVDLNCSGCSGDALQLALQNQGLQSFKVDQRSKDGKQWRFQATFCPGALEPREKGPVTRVVNVDQIDD